MDSTSVHTSVLEPKLWVCKLHGLEHGPITWEAMQALAQSGDLKASDLVRLADQQRWIVASQARYVEPGPPPMPPSAAAPALPEVASQTSAAEVTEPVVQMPSPTPSPAAPSNPSGVALLAMALALLGLFKLALPLGMLALYLGTRSACRLRHERIGAGLSLAVSAMIVGGIDVAFSLWVMLGRLSGMQIELVLR